MSLSKTNLLQKRKLRRPNKKKESKRKPSKKKAKRKKIKRLSLQSKPLWLMVYHQSIQSKNRKGEQIKSPRKLKRPLRPSSPGICQWQ